MTTSMSYKFFNISLVREGGNYMPLWRNGLARWTSISKAVGLNTIRGVYLSFITPGILSYCIAKYFSSLSNNKLVC